MTNQQFAQLCVEISEIAEEVFNNQYFPFEDNQDGFIEFDDDFNILWECR